MKDHRHGEHLWMEWSGEGYEPETDSDLVFYTEEIVDLDIPLIQKALASSLQREGLVDSLSDGHKAINGAHILQGFVGYLGEDIVPISCDAFGVTITGEKLPFFVACTWVEMPSLD